MHLAPLIRDLAVILGVAAVMTFIFRLIRQPVVLGYIIAGIIVGPHTPSFFSVSDLPNINVWAELGVIFLMFSLGLEFSFRKLAKVGIPAGVTALVQIVVMISLGFICGRLLGWSLMDSIFLSCIVAISSTTIIIKAFEEFGFKTKRFAEMVFGILIVEDLAAILMLVALSSLASQSSLDGADLMMTAGKLVLVVGGWFLVGMVVVPRFIRSVGLHGNNEMLTVLSIGLCLALVSVSAFFHFSVALGAFIMGSIIAESAEAKRVEELVQPLRDVFGAVFFVSVGMLLDPQAVVQNWGSILLISFVIIAGKILSVTLGALSTGQTMTTSVQTGFSMAQIGEFSFIIATLGLSYKVIDEKLYPIAVASSLITTFTTPYLLKISLPVAKFVEGARPKRIAYVMDKYVAMMRRSSGHSELRKDILNRMLRWLANGIATACLFLIIGNKFLPWLQTYFEIPQVANWLAWVLAFVASSPFVYGMLTSFRTPRMSISEGRAAVQAASGRLFTSRLVTLFVLGLLSLEFFNFWISLALIVLSNASFIFFFRKHLESYSRWFEQQFVAGFHTENNEQQADLERLAPWDAHLVDVILNPNSEFVGKTLIQLSLRERFGTNIVVIRRGLQVIVAPGANEVLYPNDHLLCFGTDDEIHSLRETAESAVQPNARMADLGSYFLRQIFIGAGSGLEGVSIRDSGIREVFNCIVVGIERKGERLSNPTSELQFAEGDIVWLVGDRSQIDELVRNRVTREH